MKKKKFRTVRLTFDPADDPPAVSIDLNGQRLHLSLEEFKAGLVAFQEQRLLPDHRFRLLEMLNWRTHMKRKEL